MKESARYILQIRVFVALILLIGTIGYSIIEEGLKLSDAFYMAVTAIIYGLDFDRNEFRWLELH